jgi:hypothetical protein
MPRVLQFYLDDSGTRHPDHNPGNRAAHLRDWFALGGVLINEEDEDAALKLYGTFCSRWGIYDPLHSVEIRGKTGKFHWLSQLSECEKLRFYEELYQMMRKAPLTGLACVIDRPGYNTRYREKYGPERWLLCKTAFAVVVERAAKEAIRTERKLRIMPEKCNKREDRLLKRYYEDLRTSGMPFSTDTSTKYAPLTAHQLHSTLHEFRVKEKTSPLAQFADLYLWPICMGGYNAENRPYSRLMADGKLIEAKLPKEEWTSRGSKYSCFGFRKAQ